MDPTLIALCQNKLIEVSKRRETITYGELAGYLGVANQSVGKYLNAIYENLVVNSKFPDLTLLAVYRGSRYGRYNSRGLPAQTVKFDPENPDHCRRYDSDRELVYQRWR